MNNEAFDKVNESLPANALAQWSNIEMFDEWATLPITFSNLMDAVAWYLAGINSGMIVDANFDLRPHRFDVPVIVNASIGAKWQRDVQKAEHQ